MVIINLKICKFGQNYIFALIFDISLLMEDSVYDYILKAYSFTVYLVKINNTDVALLFRTILVILHLLVRNLKDKLFSISIISVS